MGDYVEFGVEQGDVRTFVCDVIALKYARKPHGADRTVTEMLALRGVSPQDLTPEVGEHRLVKTRGAVKAAYALFLGVPRLREFRYPQIREFAERALSVISQERLSLSHVAMTIHGPGYGLDEAEALRSLYAGCAESIRKGPLPPALKRITVLDRNMDRVVRLREVMDELTHTEVNLLKLGDAVPYRVLATRRSTDASGTPVPAGPELAGAVSESKPHAFVAMPFNAAMEDVFHYGIQRPVHGNGLLCERTDHSAFVGDIMDEVKQKIRTAAVVIADISAENPNVYLEVGYAWGRGVPTVLVAKEGTTLPFDVQGHKCISYGGIMNLEAKLSQELKALIDGGVVQTELKQLTGQ